MKYGRIFTLGIILFTTLSAGAAENTTPTERNPNVEVNERNKDESWYWGFNLGGGSIKYKDSGNQALADTLKASSNVTHTTLYFDLSFLWPLANHQTAMGVALGGVVDSYENKMNLARFDVTASMIAFSVQHFFNANIGDGFFVRGDIGPASTRAELTGTVPTFSSTDSGFGLRLGVGYSILLSSDTRLPISLLWQNTTAEHENGSSALVLAAGLLF